MRGKGPGGMQNLMRQANQLQLKMKKLQDELAERSYEGTSGGGAVTVTVKGEHTLTSLKINEDVVKTGDTEMLQDMVIAAANDALKKAHETHAAEMAKITGGLNIPGMF
ncbi:MAG: YbaB/EbfC family nucleoid-associated protein [Bdellovibrionaceae bacterium]|nr:YbaB/EbfC family nucleoid-associated protein [Pseudobdellovibrionaceae bacterium]